MTHEGARPGGEQADPTSVAHFRILGRLGEGGMGVVYRAEDETLRRVVALKLLAAAESDPEIRQRFLREARSAAAISHPNVAMIHHVGEAKGRLFIAMELVDGETLRTRLVRGRLDLATARELALQMARGLAAAHEKGIVHRDLKPENVMITPEGVVKLLDFGLAKTGTEYQPGAPADVGLARTETLVTSDRTRIMGTAEYMSPEQALGRPLDVRSDVFSFGVVLYEMIAGVRPFRGLTPGEVLVAIARDPAPPLRWKVPEVDDATDALVERCLAKDPASRFASAAEMVAVLAGGPSDAWSGLRSGALTGPQPPSRPAPRRRMASVAVGLTLIVAAAGAVKVTASRRAAARLAVPVAPAAPRPTAVTDLPPLSTQAPEAVREYAQAMQARRDASIAASNAHLLRAVEIDPGFALAHLMLALSASSSSEDQRKHLASAVELRGQLGERDAAILQVVQGTLARDQPDVEDDMRRWIALADRYPYDAFVVFLAGSGCLDAGHQDEGFALLDRALALDPRFALPLHDRAVFAFTRGDLEGTVAAADRCLALSPSAASCLRRRAEAEQRLGQCERLEEDARRMVALEPEGERAYDWLATALVARGAPDESILEAYRRAREHAATPASRAYRALMDPAHVALHAGDFVSAVAVLPAMEAFAAGETSEASASLVNGYEVAVFEELGRTDRAADAAEAYLKRVPALTPDDLGYGRATALRARRLAGRLSDAAFREQRDALARDTAARLPRHLVNEAWLIAYAATSVTAADAFEALAVLPRYSPLPAFEGQSYFERAMGHVLLLGGRVDEAIPHLRRAMKACNDNFLSYPFAAEWLGEALDQKGDRAGACEAYAGVIAHWGHAKPRSVTADKARARSRVLGCAAR
jgi:serine/threonine-protein kinase